MQKHAYKIIIGSWETGEQGKREHPCLEASQVIVFNASQNTQTFSPIICPVSLLFLLLLYIPQLQYEFLEDRGQSLFTDPEQLAQCLASNSCLVNIFGLKR